MKKGYQGDEIWSAVSPVTGKWELVDPEREFIPGNNHHTVLLQAAGRLRDSLWGFNFSKCQRTVTRSKLFAKNYSPAKRSRCSGFHPGEGRVNPTVALQRK
jgi:hypothetical protein